MKISHTMVFVMAALALLGSALASDVIAQSCELSCNDACGSLRGPARKSCVLSCFAGRCDNPGAKNVADASGEPGISCISDGQCNSFCADGVEMDPDCIPFRPGYVGFGFVPSVNNQKQVVVTSYTSDAFADQDDQGRVQLSIVPCTVRECKNSASAEVWVRGPLPAGSVVNFNVFQVVGLPESTTRAICSVKGETTIPQNSVITIGPERLGNNFITLDQEEAISLRLRCEALSVVVSP